MPVRPDSAEDISVLVVDDEAIIRRSLRRRLRYEGWTVVEAASGPAALQALGRGPVDLVVLDIKMPGMDGLEVLQRIRKESPGVAVVMHTGHGDIETAVRAIQAGAAHFLEKGAGGDIAACLRMAIEKTQTLERKRLAEENRQLAEEVAAHRDRAGAGRRLVGSSPEIGRVRSLIERVAASDVRVLITGESGTGKEVAAWLIHSSSGRSGRPFVEVNCAAIPEELIESELFGAERGSYTGAHRQRIGKFEQANGGTLFLDEVGDMSARTQAKVLRALEQSQITRVGGQRSVEVDVRVLSATNQDLRGSGFRSDLLHRLEVIPLEMPPLRDRLGDVPELVAHFVGQLAAGGQRTRGFTDEALGALSAHSFPGNVRELRNLVERLLILAPGDEITAADVEEHLSPAAGPDGSLASVLRSRLDAFAGDRAAAARSLRTTPDRLDGLLAEFASGRG